MWKGGAQEGSRLDILFATTASSTIEAFVNPVAAELAARGHRIGLVTGDLPPVADFAHESAVLPMQRGMSPGADAESLRRWVSYLRTIKPRMIVAGTPKASLLGLTAARIAGVPTRVYVIHGAVWDGATGNRRRVLEAAERATIASSTHQLAVSDSLARLVHTRRLSRHVPDVLGSGSFSGVDVRHYAPTASEHPPEGSMCFVGRLHRDKGIDVLLRTLDRVRERVPTSLTIVGRLDEAAPPDSATMASLARHPYVSWVGETNDVVRFLRDSSILLFPTAREGLPQVPLEAQACGIPVVSWRVTGVVDAVRDGFTGLLVRYGDEEALAAAAVQLLTDSEFRRKVSSNSRAWVVDRFDRQVVAPRTASYLERCRSTPTSLTCRNRDHGLA